MVFGYELWKGHLKEVEGNFGTAVVSYFIFLRWLFLMNLIIFILWFGLAVIPQLIWVAKTDAPRTPSQLSCVFQLNLTEVENRECPDGPVPMNLTVPPPPASELSARVLCREEGVELLVVSECAFDTENGVEVARRERSNTVSLTTNCTSK